MVVICMKFYEMVYRVRRDYVWGGMQYKVAGTKVKNYRVKIICRVEG
jgi:hypothetical protein